MTLFQFDEVPDSRSFSLEPLSETRKYLAMGEFDNLAVQNYARLATPTAVFTTGGMLYRQNVLVEPNGWAKYLVTVPYGKKQRETGSYTFNFDTTGGSVLIKAAREHIASYPAETGNENPHLGAIGVTADNKDVEGTEVVIPALKLTVTFRHPSGVVTMPYVKTLARATGKTNSLEFLTYDAGELLYLGSTGSDGSETEAEVAYNFAASENIAAATIAGVSGIAKKGFEYVWIQWKPAVTAGEAATQARRVHVEEVYAACDFAAQFGWS